jgi:hypothetical protein
MNAYAKMKEKAIKRDKRRKLGNSSWTPKLCDKVLVKPQPVSDAVEGTTAKFMLLYNGPFFVSKVYPHSAYELKDENGKPRRKFNKKALKPYREDKQRELKQEKDRTRKGNRVQVMSDMYNKFEGRGTIESTYTEMTV